MHIFQLFIFKQKNQIYFALISQFLTYSVKLETHSDLSILTIQRYLLAFLWKASELWETKIRGKPNESKGTGVCL